MGALATVGVAFGISALSDDTDAGSAPAPAVASPDPIPSLSSGSTEPGRYTLTTYGPILDASYLITIEVPDGYQGFEGWAAIKIGTSQTAVSTVDGRGPNGGQRYLVAGELQQLWFLDVDGVPLVIDASLDPGTSARDRAELIQMVESIQIDPR